jgi:hypothetical protein
MTLFRDGILPDFNPLLTQEVIALKKPTYQRALDGHRELFDLCDTMGLLDTVTNRGEAERQLNGLPTTVRDGLIGALSDSLREDAPFGIFIVYINEGDDYTIEKSTWPNDAPRVLVVRGPHP